MGYELSFLTHSREDALDAIMRPVVKTERGWLVSQQIVKDGYVSEMNATLVRHEWNRRVWTMYQVAPL